MPYYALLLSICTTGDTQCTGDTQSYKTLAEKGPTRACPEPAGVTLNKELEELLAVFLPRAAWEGCHRSTEGAKRLPGLNKEVASSCRTSGRVLAAYKRLACNQHIEALASANNE